MRNLLKVTQCDNGSCMQCTNTVFSLLCSRPGESFVQWFCVLSKKELRQSNVILLSSIASKLLLTWTRIWSFWRIQVYKLQLCFVELHTLRYHIWISLVSFSGFSSKTLSNLFFIMKQLHNRMWNASVRKNYEETLTVTSRKILLGNYKLKHEIFLHLSYQPT